MYSASISNKYVQRQDESGWLFYLFSQKMTSTEKGIKNMEVDYTYLESTDSVTILSTVTLPESYRLGNCSITSCGQTNDYTLKLIYMRPEGKKFVYRLEAVIPFNRWEEMFNCGSPFVITYNFEGRSCPFSYPESKWDSKRKPYREIIEIIKFNTGKK